MIRKLRRFGAPLCLVLFAAGSPALAQYVQQGQKLIGSGAVGAAYQGFGVAVSGDGKTLISAGIRDTTSGGAAWVYTRSNGVWTQQGGKITPSGAVGTTIEFGTSVALSNDGNTALVGAPFDNSGAGAAFVFVRPGGVWIQQGLKLFGTGGINNGHQGQSVALSADGNTALVGATSDNLFVGAVWVFVRVNGSWTQQARLVGTNAIGQSQQGSAVALSADGNTALVGGLGDNGIGATWVFIRSGGVWTQQGNKLIGSGGVVNQAQGASVTLSGDGNTAVVGGPGDNTNAGAMWMFTRSGGVWTQQGSKFAGSGGLGTQPTQGKFVRLAADGNTLAESGYYDDSGKGAVWVFTRSGSTWTQKSKLTGTGAASNGAVQGWGLGLSGDGNTIAAGGYADDTFIGATWMFVQPVLTVTPLSNIAATGTVGGPFSPSSFGYALSAPIASVNYTVSGVPNWLTASSMSGTVAVGAAPANLNFTINANANFLGIGTYNATITIASSGAGTATLQASLNITNSAVTTLVSAVLPSSRSVQVGATATAFATVINTTSSLAINCALQPGTTIGGTFGYQITDPHTNAATGTPNQPVVIPGNQAQTFVFSITPNTLIPPIDLAINASCANASPPPVIVGVNTLLLSAAFNPVPDIIALAATTTNDGILTVPNTGGAAFAVATSNVGVSAAMTVSADNGDIVLPLSIDLCQTDPATANCISERKPVLDLTIDAGATPTFSVFALRNDTVPFDPARNRIFVRFKDAGGATRGSTSVAVRTQ